MIIHVVSQGDTLYNIANKYNASLEKMIEINELDRNESLVVGQTIVVPTDNFTYQVQSGDTLYSIAKRFGVSLDSLINSNPQIQDPSRIYIGDVINIIDSNRKLRDIEVNGYALIGINMEVLRKTLPNLTYLSIFSYQVNADGTYEDINDQALIDEARKYNVAPLMVITNIDENGFSSELASELLNSEVNKARLYEKILTTLRDKGYYGLNVDFEYLFPRDREVYNQFIKELSEALTLNGFILTTALAPKNRIDQQGLLYEAHDYAWHGRYVDRVILMTYEWGYLYGEPQAVSPINPIREVLNFASTQMPSDKILMGMSNYGYDWSLPFVQGTPAQTLSNLGAVDLARRVGSFIQFDEQTKSPYFTYYTPTNKHIVWFDDARSYYARLMLVNEYNLAGVSYWTINQYYPQNWLIINDLYNVVKVL